MNALTKDLTQEISINTSCGHHAVCPHLSPQRSPHRSSRDAQYSPQHQHTDNCYRRVRLFHNISTTYTVLIQTAHAALQRPSASAVVTRRLAGARYDWSAHARPIHRCAFGTGAIALRWCSSQVYYWPVVYVCACVHSKIDRKADEVKVASCRCVSNALTETAAECRTRKLSNGIAYFSSCCLQI